MVMHMHLEEQPKEVQDTMAYYGNDILKSRNLENLKI